MRKPIQHKLPKWLKWIVACVYSLTTAAYLVSAFIGYLDPATAGRLSVMVLAYSVILAVEVLLTVVMFFIDRRLALASIVVLAVSWPQIATVCPLNFSDGENADFRIMTYNTWGMYYHKDNDSRGQLGAVLDTDADFVCLQESGPMANFNEFTDSVTYRLLKERYPYIYVSPNFIGYMSKTPVTLLEEKRGNEYFSYAVYRTSLKGRTIYVINTHLQSIKMNDNSRATFRRITEGDISRNSIDTMRHRILSQVYRASIVRAAQADKISEVARRLARDDENAALIICGDFNDTPYSYAYLTARRHRRDAYRDGGLGPVATYNLNRLYFHIDHILYEGDIEAVRCRRGTSRASDHYPLIADFKIKNKKN